MWPLVSFVVGVYTGSRCPKISEPVTEFGDYAVDWIKQMLREK